MTDYPAIGHDRRYDNLGVNGASGLLFDTRAIGADWRFAGERLCSMSSPLDYGTRINAGILGFGLGADALPKTIFHLATPNGFGEKIMRYYISNYGVIPNYVIKSRILSLRSVCSLYYYIGINHYKVYDFLLNYKPQLVLQIDQVINFNAL